MLIVVVETGAAHALGDGVAHEALEVRELAAPVVRSGLGDGRGRRAWASGAGHRGTPDVAVIEALEVAAVHATEALSPDTWRLLASKKSLRPSKNLRSAGSSVATTCCPATTSCWAPWSNVMRVPVVELRCRRTRSRCRP